MIKTIMRKTVYKNSSDEEYESLWKLVVKRTILRILCLISIPLIFVMIFVPIIIFYIFNFRIFSIFENILICAFIIFHTTILILLILKFSEAIFSFSNILANKLYFIFFTSKGKALSKSDFEKLKKDEKYIFNSISNGICQGYCYSVSFELLKYFKEGHIEFWAINCFNFARQNNSNKPYTMHAIYIKNGWAFDTFSIKQYEVNELSKLYNAKKYKSFTFFDIKNISYDDFCNKERKDLYKWCYQNNCYVSFLRK